MMLVSCLTMMTSLALEYWVLGQTPDLVVLGCRNLTFNFANLVDDLDFTAKIEV